MGERFSPPSLRWREKRELFNILFLRPRVISGNGLSDAGAVQINSSGLDLYLAAVQIFAKTRRINPETELEVVTDVQQLATNRWPTNVSVRLGFFKKRVS